MFDIDVFLEIKVYSDYYVFWPWSRFNFLTAKNNTGENMPNLF